MKTKIVLTLIAISALAACGRFGVKGTDIHLNDRIVCISKQYNEIIFTLGAQQNIVGVDLSSIYPLEVQKLPNVGYHRALSIEGIMSLKPTLIIHDNNVGPESVMKQVADLKIPIKTFDKDGDSIAGTKMLIREIGAYFHKEKEADSICNKLDLEMNIALENAKHYTDTPRVVVIHYGRAGNSYLTITKNSTSGKLIAMAGGEIAIDGERGMQQLSAEVISKSDPDVILVTDYGYDRLGSVEKVKELPGVAGTRAAQNNRIYRVAEHDMVYFGPRTGQIIMNLQKIIHNAPTQ